MGRVDAFQVPGCDCTFYSNDHPPPHFHAKSPGEWEIKVYFLKDPPTYEVVFEIKQIPGRTRRAVLNLAALNREALFTEWDVKVRSER